VSIQHTGLALSHRCLYPTHRPGTITPVCLSNTPAWHCHTGVSTQQTGLALSHRCAYPTHRPGTVTPVCLSNTPAWHCHTGVSTQYTYLTTKAIKVFIQLLHVSTRPDNHQAYNKRKTRAIVYHYDPRFTIGSKYAFIKTIFA